MSRFRNFVGSEETWRALIPLLSGLLGAGLGSLTTFWSTTTLNNQQFTFQNSQANRQETFQKAEADRQATFQNELAQAQQTFQQTANREQAKQQSNQMRMVARLQKQQLVFDKEVTTLQSFTGALGFASSDIVPEIYKQNGKIGVLLSRPNIDQAESEQVLQDNNSLEAKTIKWFNDIEKDAVVLVSLTGAKSPDLSFSSPMPTIETTQDPNNRRTILMVLRNTNNSLLNKITEINRQGAAYSNIISANIRQ